MEVYFVEKERNDPFGSDIFLCGTENHPLSKSMVDHDQKRVKACGQGKVGNEVTGDLLEGSGCRRADGGERSNSGMGVGLVLLAGCTAFDVFTNVGGEAGPPEFGCDELASFQVPGVAGGVVIMATLENGLAE